MARVLLPSSESSFCTEIQNTANVFDCNCNPIVELFSLVKSAGGVALTVTHPVIFFGKPHREISLETFGEGQRCVPSCRGSRSQKSLHSPLSLAAAKFSDE